MTVPAPDPVPAAPAKPSLWGRVLAVVAWARTPKGRHDLAGLVAAATAVYTALHRAGV